MKVIDASAINFPSKKLLAGFEGGAVFTAGSGGKFYLILDESAMAGLLDEDDLAGLTLVKAIEFESTSERAVYILQRGWKE